MRHVEDSTAMEEVEAVLTERIGLDPSAVSPKLIARGVRVRMSALGLKDAGGYAARLRESPEEVQELIEEVVVPESWFFRDDRPFRILQKYVRERLAAIPAGGVVRILSVPCARGEEPLSIAMALCDDRIDLERVRIDGADVAAQGLEFARRGLYSSNAFRGADLGFRDRHFHPHGGKFQVDRAILGAVRWIHGNILDPGFLAGESPYHVVFCRNLLIYLTPEARLRVVDALDRLLDAAGILVVGHADAMDWAGSTRFVGFGDSGDFVFRKPGATPLQRAEASVSPAPRRAAPPPAPPRAAAPPKPAAAPPVDPPPAPAPAASLFDQAAALADQGRLDGAARLLDQHVRSRGPSAPALHLMGVVAQAAGDRDRAERCFRKAVYLDPNHDEALLALAFLAEGRGDPAAASAYRRRARSVRGAGEVS